MDINCKDISVTLNGANILKSVSLQSYDKKFVGIIGPNGSGKSTLLKCIYRIIEANKGVISLDSVDIKKISVKETAKKIAVVSQHSYYNFDFTVKEIVLMGRSPHKKQFERDNTNDYTIAMEALEKVGMNSFSNRQFATLSGGEQQRIILARALAQKTSCLILDEPTNHLDIKYQLRLLDVVKSLNFTVIAALHDLNLAAMYCDYLYVIKDGEIKKHGTPQSIFTVNFIREIYEIECEILEEKNTGLIRILFKPSK